MIKKILLFIFFIFSIFGIASASDHPLISYVPGKPLVLLSVEKLNGISDRLSSHEAVVAHKNTRDKERFDDSKLTLKLGDRIAGFGDFIGHKIDFKTLRQLSGDHTTLALYDIGDLRFLLLSDLNIKAQAALSYLDKFESLDTRKVGEKIFFVKEDPERGLSFAIYRSDNILLISNDILLIENALRIMENSREGESFEKSDEWVNSQKEKDVLFNSPMLIYLDMSRLLSDRYFRYYWLYRNQELISDYKTVVAGIDISNNGIREKRVIIGVSPREGIVPVLKSSPFAWWCEAGPGRNPKKETSEFFGWKILETKQWKNNVKGRLLALQTKKDEHGIIYFSKGEILLTDGQLNSKMIADEIINGSKNDLLIKPENYQFMAGNDGLLYFEKIKGIAGVYIKENGNKIFLANSPRMLKELENRVEIQSNNLEEASFIPMKNEFENWVNAFTQMGPDAAFYMLDIGYFFSSEMTDLLMAIGKYNKFQFEAHRDSEGRLLQSISYGE